MGIDYDGGMIVGEIGSKINCPDGYDGELYEWAEEVGFDSMSLHYDADTDYQILGFSIKDIPVDDIDGEWLDMVKEKAHKFFELTGVNARLIGTQNIW